VRKRAAMLALFVPRSASSRGKLGDLCVSCTLGLVRDPFCEQQSPPFPSSKRPRKTFKLCLQIASPPKSLWEPGRKAPCRLYPTSASLIRLSRACSSSAMEICRSSTRESRKMRRSKQRRRISTRALQLQIALFPEPSKQHHRYGKTRSPANRTRKLRCACPLLRHPQQQT
jgi:hypothetical protein